MTGVILRRRRTCAHVHAWPRSKGLPGACSGTFGGASGAPQPGNPGLNGLGTVTQGYVESSNVNVVEELVSMIETQRAYEMNSRAISTADQMLQYVSNNL